MIGHQLHEYLRAGAGYERVRVGPFLATFTPGNSHPNRNYAVPDNDVAPTPDEIAALVALYESRGLKPRLEYASSAAPALASALTAAGFSFEATIPLLTCEPGQARPVTRQGISVSDAVDERDHLDAMAVAAVAYGEEPRQVPPSWVAARMAMVDSGGAVALARDNATGEAIGCGLYPIPIQGVTELAAVGTLPVHRHRGVATIVIGHLVGRALRQGVDLVWLTAEHEEERRAAEEAGFRDTSETMIHISRST